MITLALCLGGVWCIKQGGIVGWLCGAYLLLNAMGTMEDDKEANKE